MKILGAQVTFDNCASVALQKCITNAWNAFNKHKGLLCSKRGSLKKRLDLLDKFVRPAVSYCIGSLHLTRRHLQQLRQTQFAMIRKMLGRIRPSEETVGVYTGEVILPKVRVGL